MKWYSVKKYLPAIGEEVICRVLDVENGESILLGNYDEEDKTWYFPREPVSESYRYTVTHFALPDPIEIGD